MIQITRGQAIEMSLWPRSPVIHACWLTDAEHDDGGTVIVAACGVYTSPEGARKTDAAIDCMTCLVHHVKYDRDPDEDSSD